MKISVCPCLHNIVFCKFNCTLYKNNPEKKLPLFAVLLLNSVLQKQALGHGLCYKALKTCDSCKGGERAVKNCPFFLFFKLPFWFPDPSFKIIFLCANQVEDALREKVMGAGWHFWFVTVWSSTSNMVSWCQACRAHAIEPYVWWGTTVKWKMCPSGLTAAKNSSTSAPVYTSWTREFLEFTRCKYTPSHLCVFCM